MSYLHNAWYAAGWSDEVTSSFLARTFLDIPVVLFRSEGGSVVAMHDMCPHRFAPLSMGKLINGRVRCGYHGLEFDMSGQCVGNCLNYPAPKAARVRTFPVAEQDSIVWIWMGDQPPEPIESVQRFPFHNDPHFPKIYGYTFARSDYLLLSDNLMDLTHIHLLHPGFGGTDFPASVKTWEEGESVICHYIADYEAAPTIEENIIRWTAPATHYLDSTTTPRRGEKFVIPSAHILTPETRASTHYFWSSGTPLGVSVEDTRTFLEQVFSGEDKPMVEAVQSRMRGRDFWEMKPLLLQADAGAVRVRRKLDTMIEAEQRSAANTS